MLLWLWSRISIWRTIVLLLLLLLRWILIILRCPFGQQTIRWITEWRWPWLRNRSCMRFGNTWRRSVVTEREREREKIYLPSRILGSILRVSGFRPSILPRGDWLFSAFQVPKPFGLALKSPNLGPLDIGGGDGDMRGTEGGLNKPRFGDWLGPSLSDHDGARWPHGLFTG